MGAGQCAAGGGEGTGHGEPWGLVPPGCALAPTCRLVYSEPQFPCLQTGVPSAPRGWRCRRSWGLEVLRSGGGRASRPEGPSPRCWLRQLPLPAPRPRLDRGDVSTLRLHGTGCAVTVRGREAVSHPVLPGRAPGHDGRASGEPSRGGQNLSPLASVSPPPSQEALVALGYECLTVTECWRSGPGRLPRRLQWGGPVLAKGSHWR